MKGSDYRAWMERAFYATNGMLLAEIARQRAYMTEERLRSAFLDGLVLGRTHHASRVGVERAAPWSSAVCWNDATHGKAKGRQIQHDIWIDPETASSSDVGLACELKWLKQAKGQEVAQDIWKLALSRGVAGEQSSLRTFLVIGGEQGAFQPTLDVLGDAGVRMTWSNRGRRSAALPATPLRLDRFFESEVGGAAFAALTGWGSSPRHSRTPPDCRKALRIACRAAWELVVENQGWRLALWEIDAFDCKGNLDWAALKSSIDFGCSAPTTTK